MNIYDYIQTYNEDAVEGAADYFDRMGGKRRFYAMIRFAAGAVFMLAFSLLAAYAAAGWLVIFE